jgi:hypothetical protein
MFLFNKYLCFYQFLIGKNNSVYQYFDVHARSPAFIFNKIKAEKNPKGAGRDSSPDSHRNIATFLSKNGKAVSYVTVKKYLETINLKNEIRLASGGKRGGSGFL